MSHKIHDPLEQMKRSWQQTETPPLSVEAIKRRLRWRWLFFGLDVLGLLIVSVILVVSTNWIGDVMGWIFWGFFLATSVFATFISVYLRLRALNRPDNSIKAVFEHARRDASLRIQMGRLTVWMASLIAVFVSIWVMVAAWLAPPPMIDFLAQRLFSLIFATLWCTIAITAGAWLRESGRRQHLELDCLDRELRE